MSSSHGAIVVIGSGPGIGSTTAATFAAKGFKHVVLLARSADRLKEDAKSVTDAGSHADVATITIDLVQDESTVKQSLSKIDEQLRKWGVGLEVVLFNAARIAQDEVLQMPASDLESDLRLGVVSQYIVMQWAVPQLLKTASDKSKKATYLATSGGLYNDPAPNLLSLSAVKAAQFNMVHSMSKAFSEKGIHFTQIPISGIVKPDAKLTTPQHIAEVYWELYQQGAKGELSRPLLDPDYERMIKGN